MVVERRLSSVEVQLFVVSSFMGSPYSFVMTSLSPRRSGQGAGRRRWIRDPGVRRAHEPTSTPFRHSGSIESVMKERGGATKIQQKQKSIVDMGGYGEGKKVRLGKKVRTERPRRTFGYSRYKILYCSNLKPTLFSLSLSKEFDM